jgi:hypothetical protein
MYESAVVQLLARQEVEGISPTILRAFQESYASTAFRCRFPHCDRLSLGFATAELRLEHEAVHVQRVYCQTSSCPYARIGFATKSALNAHTRKHHSRSYTSLIPAKVRRATDAETVSVPVAPITPHQKNPQQQPVNLRPFHPNSFGPQQQPITQRPENSQQQLDVQQAQLETSPFGNIDGPDVSVQLGFRVVQRADERKSSSDLGNLGFSDDTALENFDFDSFLQNPNDDSFRGLGGEFDFNHVSEAYGDL